MEDHYDSPMALLDGDAEVMLVMADVDECPVAAENVTEVRLARYGMDERALWLVLGDGRKFAVVWSRPKKSRCDRANEAHVLGVRAAGGAGADRGNTSRCVPGHLGQARIKRPGLRLVARLVGGSVA